MELHKVIGLTGTTGKEMAYPVILLFFMETNETMSKFLSSFLRKAVLSLFLISCTECKCYGTEEAEKKEVNPFLIDFPVKQELSRADYIEVQKRLRAIDIDPILKENYVDDPKYTAFGDFQGRCCRGLKQVLIDPENNEFPLKRLEKIGNGGDYCITSCVPLTPKYISLLKSIPDALKEVGFNGYFLYRIGGYPNPTGKEIRYAGVPYAFKIFMMLEAKNLGFNKVIWIDSSLMPLKDPTPLFKKLEEEESLLTEFRGPGYTAPYIFPKTKELLYKLTGVDVVNQRRLCTWAFGLKMDSKKVENFISAYYSMVERGTPFISCFPEEFVFSSIIEQSPMEWPGTDHSLVMRYQYTEDPKELADSKAEQSAFFYLRFH